MSVHIERLSSVAYFYAPGQSYDNADEPEAVATVCRTDHGAVEVMAAHGNLRRCNLREMINKIGRDGGHTIRIKRRFGHRVPFGHLVKSDGKFDIYEVTLADLEAP